MKSRVLGMCTVGSPRGSRGPVPPVPFDNYSLADKFEWIMNESKTIFELSAGAAPCFSRGGAVQWPCVLSGAQVRRYSFSLIR